MSSNGGKRPFNEWVPEKGETLQRQPGKVYVVSSFGLFVGLLRQREISERLVSSEFFARIKDYVNTVCVDSQIGAKSNEEQTIQNLNAKIVSLELELEKWKSTSSAPSSPTSFTSPSTSPSSGNCNGTCFSAGSSPSSNTSGSSTECSRSPSSIEELTVSPLGPIKKKKLIQERCRTMLSLVSALCENMNESISSLFGHTLTHGLESECQAVKNTISELVRDVIKVKGTQNTLRVLLTEEVHEELISGIRVTDWTQFLYLKLLTRTPDAAWQILLN